MQNTSFRQNLDFVTIVIISCFTLAFLIYWNLSNPRVTVRYDCSLSEISPDYPIPVKEACRKLRAENILNKPK